MMQNKETFYDKNFERNWNNFKSTAKAMKSILLIKAVAPSVPTVPPLIKVIL